MPDPLPSKAKGHPPCTYISICRADSLCCTVETNITHKAAMLKLIFFLMKLEV